MAGKKALKRAPGQKVGLRVRKTTYGADYAVTTKAKVVELYVVGDPKRVASLRADRQYFAQNRARLVRRYPDEYVAILRGRVVGHDKDIDALSSRVRDARDVPAFFIGHTASKPVTAALRVTPRTVEN